MLDAWDTLWSGYIPLRRKARDVPDNYSSPLVKINAHPGNKYLSNVNLPSHALGAKNVKRQKEYYHKKRNGFAESNIYLADAYTGVRFTLCFTFCM